jgi:hypothetical protein
MSDSIKAWPNWQDGAPTVPGWYGVQWGTREREAYDIAQVFPDGAVRGSAGINWSICRFCPLPDFAAMSAERDAERRRALDMEAESVRFQLALAATCNALIGTPTTTDMADERWTPTLLQAQRLWDERTTIRAEVDRLAAAVNEANERADRAERNAADPLPWGET